jgi:peptidoglycan hydrolase-like protein with peptidoglycan-binding domain
MRPVEDPSQARAYTYATVAQGEVGADLTLNAVASWEQTEVGANQASGIVTTVRLKPGDMAEQGTVLYSVNLRPVVVAQGIVPAFREISLGTEGADVRQLQELLGALGHYQPTPDGKAGPSTVEAIKLWQEDLGVARTGIVGVGDIIFVPRLPVRLSLNTEVVARGKAITGGEPVVRALPPQPGFAIPVTDDQALMITIGTPVEVTSPDGDTWHAVTGDQVRDQEAGGTVVRLTGRDGQPVCADQCAQVPVTGQTLLISRVVITTTVRGLVVPSAALVTDAGGKLSVIDQSGTLLPVTVVESARGMSVVEGVDEGARVRVPGEAQ